MHRLHSIKSNDDSLAATAVSYSTLGLQLRHINQTTALLLATLEEKRVKLETEHGEILSHQRPILAIDFAVCR